jgi:iron uptake system EfeUOB component EfeO/EfeM
MQNVKCYINNTECESVTSIVPDATKTLILASSEQKTIGWEHWFKGRISLEWAALVKYNIETITTGKKFNSSEKWAMEIIKLCWDFVFDMWLE